MLSRLNRILKKIVKKEGFIKIVEKDLTTGNERTSRFTKTQAEEFAQKWEIVSHIANTGTGFSGTLFRARKTDEEGKADPETGIKEGDLVISFRSTEFIDDSARDNQATNSMEISDKGWAFGQIADMEKWVQSLKKAEIIGNGKEVSVTGYSLGGHLATVFNILHNYKESDIKIKQTFTFNGAGVGLDSDGNEMSRKKLENIITTFSEHREYDADFSLSISALRATKIGQQKSAGCFSDISSVKSSLHFINGAES